MSKECWLWLAAGLGSGAANSGELLAAYPDGAEAILMELGNERLKELLSSRQAERLAGTHPEDFLPLLAQAEERGLAIVAFDESAYPENLRGIYSPPPVLFVQGDVSLLNAPLPIAVVGARRPSAYGVEIVKEVGRGLALGGAVIVSGLAAGLDAEAHKAALAVQGATVACIAFGHGRCYPSSNRRLMEQIEKSGAVISEYPPETRPEKAFFLQRNRLIAGLSHGLVVAEARRHSGTMSTVNFAADFGRDVFAIPGSIFSELSTGTNAMIREGAYLVANAADILSVYGVECESENVAQNTTASLSAKDFLRQEKDGPEPPDVSGRALEEALYALLRPLSPKAPGEEPEAPPPNTPKETGTRAKSKTNKRPEAPAKESTSLSGKKSAAGSSAARDMSAAPVQETNAVFSHKLTENAQRVLRCLGAEPLPLPTICQNSGFSSAQAMAALTELELAGFSRQLAGRRFVIMQ